MLRDHRPLHVCFWVVDHPNDTRNPTPSIDTTLRPHVIMPRVVSWACPAAGLWRGVRGSGSRAHWQRAVPAREVAQGVGLNGNKGLTLCHCACSTAVLLNSLFNRTAIETKAGGQHAAFPMSSSSFRQPARSLLCSLRLKLLWTPPLSPRHAHVLSRCRRLRVQRSSSSRKQGRLLTGPFLAST